MLGSAHHQSWRLVEFSTHFIHVSWSLEEVQRYLFEICIAPRLHGEVFPRSSSTDETLAWLSGISVCGGAVFRT